MKKAQTEIIGLAIIIVIITLGLLFYLRLSRKDPNISSVSTDYRTTKLASNLLSVILRTTDDCQDLEIKELFQACAEDITSIQYCDTNDPCERAKELVEGEILAQTVEEWGIPYHFTAKIEAETKIENGTRCPGQRQTERYPIPTDKGPMILRLDICQS
ncbi:MAG: hypothetical protein MAG795_00872 [Candidatus Woesearchaeota archaeon]|nr:hypothetical protein [Candidatus Woesearchaeota archaeon]